MLLPIVLPNAEKRDVTTKAASKKFVMSEKSAAMSSGIKSVRRKQKNYARRVSAPKISMRYSS